MEIRKILFISPHEIFFIDLCSGIGLALVGAVKG